MSFSFTTAVGHVIAIRDMVSVEDKSPHYVAMKLHVAVAALPILARLAAHGA